MRDEPLARAGDNHLGPGRLARGMVFVTTFVASLLTGGLGVYLGARYVVDSSDYVNAAITGLIGAVVLVVGGALFGWVPLLGQVLLFAVYVALIGRRYPGDWGDAASIAAIAWATVLVVLAVLAVAGVVTVEVVGVPDVPDLGGPTSDSAVAVAS